MGGKRRLNNQFMNDLKTGHLSQIRKLVRDDRDLLLDIRAGYIDIYYKGHQLLKLTQQSTSYRTQCDKKFKNDVEFPEVLDSFDDVQAFLNIVPGLKHAIATHRPSGNEVEMEQLLIRANNHEPGINSEYFIVDRQYAIRNARFDMVGFYWGRDRRRSGQTVPLVLFEVKYGLHGGVEKLVAQVEQYHEAISDHFEEFANEMESLFRQKVELGLYSVLAKDGALDSLQLSRDVDTARIALVLADYNPHSKRLGRVDFNPDFFPHRIDVFSVGYGLWKANSEEASRSREQ